MSHPWYVYSKEQIYNRLESIQKSSPRHRALACPKEISYRLSHIEQILQFSCSEKPRRHHLLQINTRYHVHEILPKYKACKVRELDKIRE